VPASIRRRAVWRALAVHPRERERVRVQSSDAHRLRSEAKQRNATQRNATQRAMGSSPHSRDAPSSARGAPRLEPVRRGTRRLAGRPNSEDDPPGNRDRARVTNVICAVRVLRARAFGVLVEFRAGQGGISWLAIPTLWGALQLRSFSRFQWARGVHRIASEDRRLKLVPRTSLVR
jgi:hypothetical protein